jgi:hypothetical protein
MDDLEVEADPGWDRRGGTRGGAGGTGSQGGPEGVAVRGVAFHRDDAKAAVMLSCQDVEAP